MTATESDVIDIQPHPRLLGVLGDIEFQPWQCLAELIDNAFDEFLRQNEWLDPEAPFVQITLPGRNSNARDGEVWVRDNGPGMTLERLNNALRAGWTNNERYGQLGLFGVGFNIATARLGQIAVVRTTRAQDASWTSVTIDLRAMEAGGSFLLPVMHEPKTAPGEHGTEIVIRSLKPEHHEILSRQQAKIRTVLGDVYSYLLQERGFRLIVDGEAVKPRRACVWDESRYVVRNNERIPAVIRIDEPLADRSACQDCGRWQDTKLEVCEDCGSNRLQLRQRRIWGWLGIQRYTHKSDYGIDFLRNGRKILRRDLRLFWWKDPDDPIGRGEQEYPIEVPGTGRIVGEIHIDHVRVNYQKNAFEYDTPDWKRVERLLRGEGPIRPKRASELRYPVNTSPLAKLFAGYRRNDPGLNYLVPGDGRHAIHEKAKEWADHFRKGVPEYQTDERWYEAARLHDHPPVHEPEPQSSTDKVDILAAKGLLPPSLPAGGTSDGAGEPTSEAGVGQARARAETEDERRARWRADAESVPDLEGKYDLPGHGAAVQVTVWMVRGHFLTRANGSERLPVYVGPGRPPRVEVFVDAEHPVFAEYAADTRDLIVLELAEYLRARAGTDRSLSALFYEIKHRCLPDHKISGAFLTEMASRLLDRIREAMQPVVAGNAAGYWALVTDDERAAAERTFAVEGGADSWDDVRGTGEWLAYVPASSLVRLLQQRPEAFLDARVFRSAYSALSDPMARTVAVERLTAYLSDVAVLADRPGRRTTEELQRSRLSCYLLERELALDDKAEADGPQ